MEIIVNRETNEVLTNIYKLSNTAEWSSLEASHDDVYVTPMMFLSPHGADETYQKLMNMGYNSQHLAIMQMRS